MFMMAGEKGELSVSTYVAFHNFLIAIHLVFTQSVGGVCRASDCHLTVTAPVEESVSDPSRITTAKGFIALMARRSLGLTPVRT